MQKSPVYNLTAYYSIGKHKTCTWPEIQKSVGVYLVMILQVLYFKFFKKILTLHPNIKNMIIWSDSCVPQNSNSNVVIIAKFLIKNPTVDRVTMKYSIVGPSCIQEADNIHSRIEKYWQFEIWFPLVRLILKIVRRSLFLEKSGWLSFKVIRMKKCFLIFMICQKDLLWMEL